jgi:hypothetical protein
MQLAFDCMVGYNNYNTVTFQQNFRCSTIYDLTYGYKIKSLFWMSYKLTQILEDKETVLLKKKYLINSKISAYIPGTRDKHFNTGAI